MANNVVVSEEQYCVVFEQAADAMVLIEPETDLIFQANKSASTLLGFTQEELCMMHLVDLDVGATGEPESWYSQTIVPTTGNLFTTRKKCRNGDIIDVEVSCGNVGIEGKTLRLETWRDITARKRKVEALHENETRLKEALELASIGSWELNLVNNAIIWSKEVFEIFEIDPAQFGATYEAFLNTCHPDDRSAVDVAYTNSLKTHTKYEIDHRLLFPDGRIKYVHEQCRSYFNENLEPIRSIGTVLDITERKLAETELRNYKDHLEELVAARTAALAASNAELERFAYISSHDLQEPLRMVTCYLQLLEKRYKDKLDDDANDFINFAVDGAKRMKTLINDLLSYSRVGTKGRKFEPINCEQVVKDALDNLAIAIKESGARITYDFLPTVMGDATQLVQLFQNLIGNAVKFRGTRQPEILIRTEEKNGFWKFSVHDNGIGIKQEHFGLIFQVFQRLHGRDEYPGNGIGLAICKKIVERHGGTIEVESVPGVGSTFIFTINTMEPDDGMQNVRKTG
jgi:PAS domain S-box-containing protein